MCQHWHYYRCLHHSWCLLGFASVERERVVGSQSPEDDHCVLDISCLSCLIHIYVLFSRVKLNSRRKHYAALRVREWWLVVVSSETAFFSSIDVGQQHSCRAFWCTCCAGTVVMVSTHFKLPRFIPSHPFSIKVTMMPSPLRLLLQITQFNVSSINIWKSSSKIVRKLQIETFQLSRRTLRA